MEQNMYNRGLGFQPFNAPAFGMGGYPFVGYSLSSNPTIQSMPWPLTFQDKSTQYNLNELVSNIKKSIIEETNEVGIYDAMANKAPNDEQKEIIMSIAENEKLHSQILSKIFTELTGVVMPMEQSQNMQTPPLSNLSYIDMLKKAFMGELEAIEKYREFLAYAPNKEIYDMIFYILSDEIRHALKYNYLITMNKT